MNGASITTNSASIILSGSTSQFPALAPVAINNGMLQLLAGRSFTAASPFQNFGTLSEGSGVEAFSAPQFSQGSLATLGLELDGSPSSHAFDQVIISGNANLNGILSVSIGNGYQPQVGDIFEVLSAGSVAGQFSSVTWQNQFGSGEFVPIYTPTDVLISYVPEPSLLGLLSVCASSLLCAVEDKPSLNCVRP